MTGNGQSRARKFLTRFLAAAALVAVYTLATAGVTSVIMTTTDSSAQAWRGRGRGWRGRGWRGGGWGCRRWTPAGWIWVC